MAMTAPSPASAGLAVTSLRRSRRVRRSLPGALLATVYESVDEGIVAFGPDMRVLAWNKRYEALHGFPSGVFSLWEV